MAERFDRIWHNARLATVRKDLPDLGVIERGAIAMRDGRIAFAGAQADLPANVDAVQRIDCEGRWITPGLIDCHTHLVYAGNRAHEFELRLQGATYEEIAGRQRGRPSRERAAAARRADRRGRHHARDQVRLWAQCRDRDAPALRRAHAGPQSGNLHPHHVSRRPCAAHGSAGRQGSLYRPRLR